MTVSVGLLALPGAISWRVTTPSTSTFGVPLIVTTRMTRRPRGLRGREQEDRVQRRAVDERER